MRSDITALMWFLIIGTSIWVLVDAKTIGVKKTKKEFFNMGPAGWFVACLLLWIVAFPAYLAKRQKYKRRSAGFEDQEFLESVSQSGSGPIRGHLHFLQTIIIGSVLLGVFLGIVGLSSTQSELDVNGLPKCGSDLAKDTAKKAFANSAMNKLVNVEILSFESIEYMAPVNQNDDKTLCKADVITNMGKRLMYYTISKMADGNFYVYAHLQRETDDLQ